MLHCPLSFGQTVTRQEILIEIATARCARVSYTVVGAESKEHNYQKDIELHDRLLSSGHMSPFEHCARAMTQAEYASYVKGCINALSTEEEAKAALGWCNNFRGFVQYRKIVE
jgi:hypothetical protein